MLGQRDILLRLAGLFNKYKIDYIVTGSIASSYYGYPRAEVLILTKLLWCKQIKSERHIRDCVGIIKVQENKLDEKYLQKWSKKLGLTDLLSEIYLLEY